MPATESTSAQPRAPRARSGGARALQKGQQTKQAIIEAALGLATHIGLEGLSIGALADVMGMSRSPSSVNTTTASSKRCSTPPCRRRVAYSACARCSTTG